MRIVVVTASIGERRGLLTPMIDRRRDGVKYLAFVDRPKVHAVWETIGVRRPPGDPVRSAKRYKTAIVEHVGDADATIWIDRHCRLLCDPLTIFNEFHEDVGLIRHFRRCCFSEANACRKQDKDDPAAIDRTMDRLKAEGFSRNAGLYYGGFVLRRHNASDEFSRTWADYIEDGSRRDQLTLPAALEASGVSFKAFDRSMKGKCFAIRGK